MESPKIVMIRLFIFNLGLTAMATQVIMIRETLAIFQGNELIIGLFLGFWMLLTAIGSILISHFAIRFEQFPAPTQELQHPKSSNHQIAESPNRPIAQSSPPPRLPAPLLLLLALLPLTGIFTLIYLRYIFIPSGVMAGLGQTSLVIFLAISPFCLVSGILFPLFVKELSAQKEKNLLHEGYALDSAGSILGGLLFSLVFIFILNPFESLLILTCICLCLTLIWSWMNHRKARAVSILLIGTVILVILIILKPEKIFNELSFKNQEVIEVKASPFGKLAVTRIGEQLNLYINGVPAVTGNDPIFREESVHYAMLMHPSAEKVLLISGGTAGIIEEILKYPVKKIDYLEINPWMIRLIEKYRPLSKDSRVSYFYKDPRIFLDRTGEKYDVILLNTPEPGSAELNRFYTREFFQLLRKKLNPGGIISLSIPPAGNYMNETSRMAHSVCYNTLKTVFPFIRIIPGWKDYYLASDSTLDHSLFKDYQSLGFTNLYVNPSYINEDLLKMRTDLIMKDLFPQAPINSDLKPYTFALNLRHWLEKFRIDYRIIPVSLLVIIVIGFLFLGPLNLGLFTGGFTASAIEFILLIWFQVIYGFLYQMTGVIFAVFMAGLAIGSFYRLHIYKNNTFKGFLNIQASIAVFSATLASLMLIIPSNTSNWSVILLIMILVFITGLLMGIQFSLSSQLRKSSVLKSSGESFSADLLGSAIGIGLVSVYLVPQIGLPMTGIALAGLNVVALGLVYLKQR
jgi:predicted membrane-bound spermidine synthase